MTTWSEDDAQALVAQYGAQDIPADLALRTYSARLLGRDPSWVLHGGGNTSVKGVAHDLTGDEVEVLYVKGSGWDLATIEPQGHPAVRLNPLRKLRALGGLSDEAMVNQQRINLLDATAPNPSVETLLHAFLPHRFIDHTHADAILALVDQPNGEALIRDLFGDRFGIVDYIMPGFALAKRAAEVFDANPEVEGLILLKHGIFTFGDSARQSFERMATAIGRAEVYLEVRKPAATNGVPHAAPERIHRLLLILRGALSLPGDEEGSYRRWALALDDSEATLAFIHRPDLKQIGQRGPITPDHVIRTKPLPLILDDLPWAFDNGIESRVEETVAAYGAEYRARFERCAAARGVERTMLDVIPRVILIPEVGMVTVGATPKDAAIAADLYRHTIEVITAAESVGRYEPLGELDLFDMEYWSLEQAKLGKNPPKPLAGQVVLVTGAGSGIGAETARVFEAQGAVVALWDIDPEGLERTRLSLRSPGVAWVERVDVTERGAVEGEVEQIVRRYGGIDGVISNAGKAWSAPLAEASEALIRQSLELNWLSHQWVAAAATRVMKGQGTGGFLLFNASKSSFTPGPDFGPYSVPKGAVVTLMKQYAVDYAADGIRTGAVNADRVRTQLFGGGVLEERLKARGLSEDQYFRGNMLSREVTAGDVAEAFLYLATALKTTGATIPVDGGNIGASPR